MELEQLQGFIDFYTVNLKVFFWEVKLFCLILMPLGDQEGRLDLSHPVHVDNCLLEPETNQCWRESPAFIHRDLRYTEIIIISKETTNTNKINIFFLSIENLSFYGWMTDLKTYFSHSAILYLNDNFDGGELFFTNRDAKTVTVSHFSTLIPDLI